MDRQPSSNDSNTILTASNVHRNAPYHPRTHTWTEQSSATLSIHFPGVTLKLCVCNVPVQKYDLIGRHRKSQHSFWFIIGKHWKQKIHNTQSASLTMWKMYYFLPLAEGGSRIHIGSALWSIAFTFGIIPFFFCNHSSFNLHWNRSFDRKQFKENTDWWSIGALIAAATNDW